MHVLELFQAQLKLRTHGGVFLAYIIPDRILGGIDSHHAEIRERCETKLWPLEAVLPAKRQAFFHVIGCVNASLPMLRVIEFFGDSIESGDSPRASAAPGHEPGETDDGKSDKNLHIGCSWILSILLIFLNQTELCTDDKIPPVGRGFPISTTN